jgi:hypothetical protein
MTWSLGSLSPSSRTPERARREQAQRHETQVLARGHRPRQGAAGSSGTSQSWKLLQWQDHHCRRRTRGRNAVRRRSRVGGGRPGRCSSPRPQRQARAGLDSAQDQPLEEDTAGDGWGKFVATGLADGPPRRRRGLRRRRVAGFGVLQISPYFYSVVLKKASTLQYAPYLQIGPQYFTYRPSSGFSFSLRLAGPMERWRRR